MSKASQRKEAERRKRLEKQYGERGAKMVQVLERLGPEAMETASQFLEIACELGPKQKDTPQRRRLEKLANDLEEWVKTVWRAASCWGSGDEEQFGFGVPPVLMFWGKDSDDIAHSCIPREMPRSVAETGSAAVVAWMFDHADRRKLPEIDAAMLLVGGGEGDDFATVCLFADRSGTRAARAMVEGRWIKARVPEPCFGLGSLIAAVQGEAWSKRASVRALLGSSADEPVVIEVGGDGTPPTSTTRSELLQDAISTSHWPLLELCFRLGMDCVSAEEEAEEAWGIVDQTTGDAIGRDEALERATALEKQLADARAEIKRLVQAAKSDRGRPAAPVATAAPPEQPSPGVPPEAKQDRHTRLVERMHAFF